MNSKPTLLIMFLLLATLSFGVEESKIFLPGSQPGENDIEFAKVAQCQMCHSGTPNGEADPYFSWSGGMMAQAARDPIFRATVAIANQDIPDVGEFCFRCHTPRAWLEGRSLPADGSALLEEDMHGVSCDVCHRFVDPMSEEAKGLASSIPPGYGNAMMVADPANVVRGPYGDAQGAMPHKALKSDFHASSDLCGLCHNVSNPVFAEDVRTQPPYAFGHVERTFSEWSLSAFPEKGQDGTCQSCHYPEVEGGGQASRYGSPHRDHFVMHGPVGSSAWIQEVTYELWGGKNMEKKALDAAVERARKLLRTAADLEVKAPVDNQVVIRITNKTGHKLPTGYPEGRRMWLNVRFLGTGGNVIEEFGRFGETTAMLNGEEVTVETLLDADVIKVYECLPGISEETAAKFGIEPGKSFHFVLNDMIAKDNRIPPEGFNNVEFAKHLAAPVGASYADGQNWDEQTFDVPVGTAKIEATLHSQSMSWEYLKFLVEENKTDDWSKRLYKTWQLTDRCPPETIATATLDVANGG
ncbi:cytochrome c family protein [bacterium]|nr:cytochrome c family protein [bacterium]